MEALNGRLEAALFYGEARAIGLPGCSLPAWECSKSNTRKLEPGTIPRRIS